MNLKDNTEHAPHMWGIQGSPEWRTLRKTKICATDAPVIMGVNKWKSLEALYLEKTQDTPDQKVTPQMQRGVTLEPIARELFSAMSGIEMFPHVVIKEWALASLDGISEDGKYIVEIKCPGRKDHEMALSGIVPDHYYPQLQHQLFVCDLPFMYYFSFDGIDGHILRVARDEKYIQDMVEKELVFFNHLQNKSFSISKSERLDFEWMSVASQLRSTKEQIFDLEIKKKQLEEKIIELASGEECYGGGISLKKINRKGSIKYDAIPEIKSLDLEMYRSEPTIHWRIDYK